MATLDENYHWWNHTYDWSGGGEEWSGPWGGSQAQWRFCLYPRLHRRLPAQTILEIGAGHGRWSAFLSQHCHELILLDLSEKCIHACRQRFGEQGVSYRVGDGRSLPAVDDSSVDLVFSFESLVLSEAEVMADYLKEIERVLKPEGAAFLHHSNLGAYPRYYRFLQALPTRLTRRFGLLDFGEWRSASVSAEVVAELAQKAGLHCHSQELINWGGRRLIDCFSVVSLEPGPTRVSKNSSFTRRSTQIRQLAGLYCASH